MGDEAPDEEALAALRRTREALVALQAGLDSALIWLRAEGAGGPRAERNALSVPPRLGDAVRAAAAALAAGGGPSVEPRSLVARH